MATNLFYLVRERLVGAILGCFLLSLCSLTSCNNAVSPELKSNIEQQKVMICAQYCSNDTQRDKCVSNQNDCQKARFYQGQLRTTTAMMLTMIFCYVLNILLLLALFGFWIKNLRQSKRNLMLKLDKYESLLIVKKAKTREKEQVLNSDIYKVIRQHEMEENYKITDAQWSEIKKLVNETFPKFEHNLRLFYDVNVHEYRVCLLIKMGFSPTSIAKFTSRSKEAITSVRSRLYAKTFKRKGSAPKWDEFIKSL